VITAGTTWPHLSEVLLLYAFTKSMMATPCCPRIGPKGGAGLASPPFKFTFTTVFTFFAAIFYFVFLVQHGREYRSLRCATSPSCDLCQRGASILAPGYMFVKV